MGRFPQYKDTTLFLNIQELFNKKNCIIPRGFKDFLLWKW
jgi:hypothetical protein